MTNSTHVTLGHGATGPLRVDVPTLIDTRQVITASSGGGKSYLLRRLIELIARQVQVIVIDPEGEFNTLRERFDMLLVGAGGEIAPEVRTARQLARKLGELRVSAIIDLYDLGDWDARREFLAPFLDGLMNLPKADYHPIYVPIDEAHNFCMDAETQILTSNGWVGWQGVNRQTVAVCFNPKSGNFHNEMVLDVIIKQHDGEVVSLKSDGIDCLVTPDHRVVLARIQRAQGRYEIYPWTFCPAGEVPNHVYVPTGGAPEGAGVAGLSADLARLLGLVITDGSFTGGDPKRYLTITQADATVKQGRNIGGEIETLFSRLGGKTIYQRPERKRRGKQTSPSREFYLGVDLSAILLFWLGSEIHRIPRLILEQGSRAQLEALYDGLCMGDGTGNIKWGWTNFYPGHNEGLADDFQELVTRLGISTSKRWVEFKTQAAQWVVNITRRTRHYIRRPIKSHYNGIVWDITVPSGAFVARRHGRVFVTGNCPQDSTGKKGSPVFESRRAIRFLMSAGRKRAICGALATQRISKLDKDSLADAKNVFIGGITLDVDQERAGDMLGLGKADRIALRDLEAGEFYAFGPAVGRGVLRFKTDPVITTHPRAGQRHLLEVPPASGAIQKIVAELSDIPRQVQHDEDELAAAQRQVSELTRELRARPVQAPLPLPAPRVERVEVTVFRDGEVGRLEAAVASLTTVGRQFAVFGQQIGAAGDQFQSAAGEVSGALKAAAARVAAPVPVKIGPTGPVATPKPAAPLIHTNAATAEPGRKLPKAERSILTVLAQRGSRTKRQVAVQTGYAVKGGGFNNAVSALASAGFVTRSGDTLEITAAGVSALSTWESLPTGQALLDYWLNQLPKAERAILGVLINDRGALSKEQIAQATGYEAGGGGFNNAVSRLRTLELVSGTKELKASEELFD